MRGAYATHALPARAYTRPPPADGRGPAAAMVLGGIGSVQIGAAVATSLFDEVGPAGTVLLRCGFSAVLLLALWRPVVQGLAAAARRDVALFGLILAAMNLCFYVALERIPLGVAVTFEFVGPLGIAAWRSRRPADLAWVALAAAGLLLLSPLTGEGAGGSLDGLGVALALAAGGFWGAYIVVTARVGRAFEGGAGLAIAMALATVLLLPVGIADGGGGLLDPGLLAAGFAVAMLSSAIPYSLELEALRRLPEGVFGVMMSLEPAVAAAVGFVALEQDLVGREIVAIGLVLAASAGALGASGLPRAPEA